LPGAAVAAKATETITSSGGSCGRRATKRSDWRGGRAAGRWRSGEAARALLCTPVFSGPASGMAGDRGGDLAGAAPSGAQRSDLQAGQFAKRA
jgi:hypothetical protein